MENYKKIKMKFIQSQFCCRENDLKAAMYICVLVLVVQVVHT